ncbi:MAG: hypothetical protein QF856_01675, partial [Candidatus Marinimicrobia bacterium]|nr:hypothetical protein [Candidatus Neomarinimicrobiota bacterium]
GSFQLTGIENGRYTIIALEGIISDIGKQIRKKNYAMLTSSYITISSEENEKNVKMLLSEPLEKLQITSVEMQSQYCSQLTLNNNSKELIIIDSLLSPGDSIFVHLEKTNQLETYQVLAYSFILPEIRDTLAPVLSQSFFESDIFTLIFSEPINLNVNAIVSTQDSVDISIPFSYKNEFSIIIPNIPDTLKKIQLLGEHIQDWAGNIFADSLKILRITRPEIEDELKNGGNIIGFVNYDDNYPIKIEAQKIGSDSKHFVNVNNKKYTFSNLSPGLYKLWGFEEINNLDGEVYNSGIWSPYQRAARFALYPDTIDVRARWDIKGVIIDFNSLQKMDQSLKIINSDTIDNKTTLTNKRKNTNDNKPYKVGNEKIDDFVDQSYELIDQLDKIINNLDETNKMLNEISSHPGGASGWSKSEFFKEIENPSPLDIAGELREYLFTLKENLESLPEDVKKTSESFINLSKIATELPPELKTLSFFKMFKAFFTTRSTLKELKKIPDKIENIKSIIDSISEKINHILSKL